MGSTLFRDPQARSSALAALGSLQPRAFGSLNRVDPLDSVSNYYLKVEYDKELSWLIPLPGDWHILKNYQEVLLKV